MFWLFGYSFLSGIGTFLAPVIWPVIPMVLSPSIVGKDQRKSLGIVTGIIISFGLFTFITALFFQIFHVDTSISKTISGIVTAFFGILLIKPDVTRKLNDQIRRFAKKVDMLIEFKEHSFSDGVITGIVLGLIWSPSTGPIIAMISAITKPGQIFTDVLLITIAYILGFGISLFILAYAGQRFFRQKNISPHASRIQLTIGAAMIISAIIVITNLDVFLGKEITKIFPQAQPLFQIFGNKPAFPDKLQQ